MNENTIESLAKVLFRRHLIDVVEMERMAAAVRETGDKCGKIDLHYDRMQHEFYERDVDSQWYASGQNRAYWVQLAREALSFVENTPLTPPPKELYCALCRGKGRYLKHKFADHFSICECGTKIEPDPLFAHMPILDDGWHKTKESKS